MPKTLAPEQSAWLAETIARNKARFGGFFMEDGADDDKGGDGAGEDKGDDKGGSNEQTFTQADVDRLVGRARTDARKAAEAKFADYDDLKAKAAGAKTLEDRVGELESKGAASEQRALRAEIAAEFGISTKREKDADGNELRSDAELFLTATDEAGLRSQAQRLADRKPEGKPGVTSDADASGKAKPVDGTPIATSPGLGTLRSAYADAAKK